MMKSWIVGLTALGAAAAAAPAQAGYVADLKQFGAGVVATGSGTLDLRGLSLDGSGVTSAAVIPSLGLLVLGTFGSYDYYVGISGPQTFGGGAGTVAGTESGDVVGVEGWASGPPGIDVPQGYVSGAALSSSNAYTGQTFASLGVTPGTYVWTWGQGATADSFTLNITAAPEPASWALMLAGACALGGCLRRRRGLAAA